MEFVKTFKILYIIRFALSEIFFLQMASASPDQEDFFYFMVLIGILWFVAAYNIINTYIKKYSQKNERNITFHENIIYQNQEPRNNRKVSILDMYQFTGIPFEWQWVMQLHQSGERSWFDLNMNNKYVAMQYIYELSELITKSAETNDLLKDCFLCTEEIDFDYPVPMLRTSLPCTYVECKPYTKTGKISKYPVTLHFASSEQRNNMHLYPVFGEIDILKDGNIGKGYVRFFDQKLNIQFGLYGISLRIKKITNIETTKVLYKLEKEESED